MRFATTKDGATWLVRDGRAWPMEVAAGDVRALAALDADERRGLIAAPEGPGASAKGLDLGPPVPNPTKIVAIGLNYLDHATETTFELPTEPLVFAKFPSALVGPRDPIRVPLQRTRQVDFEAELAVVVGRRARHVAAADALDHVFGYTVLNDVSARDLQFGDTQWVRGKSLDSFCPCGPFVVTADEVADPQALRVGCAVDGAVMQDASTADMIFGVARLIEFLSAHFTLEPGDLIATGTPSGVGYTRRPPVYLVPGTRLTTWVDGIGSLDNPVVAA